MLLAGLFVLFLPSVTGLKAQDEIKVILVDLGVPSPAEASKAYTTSYDRKKVELTIDIDHPINEFEDFGMMEDPLDGPECFMPEMKIVFERYTYVFSLYCTAVMKYSNSAPYVTSAKKVPNDFEMTESILEYLKGARKKYFATATDLKVAAKFVKPVKIYDDQVDDSDLLRDEEDPDDKEMQKDAVDKEGWFDDRRDPGLEEDDTPDVPDDDK